MKDLIILITWYQNFRANGNPEENTIDFKIRAILKKKTKKD